MLVIKQISRLADSWIGQPSVNRLIMLVFSSTVQKSIDAFKRLPGMGPRQATRCVFYLLKTQKEEFTEFIEALQHAKEQSQECRHCFRIFEASGEDQKKACEICSNPKRDKNIIMIVETDRDLVAIERIKKFTGHYIVLKGNGENYKKDGANKQIEITRLVQLLKERSPQEVIVATNLTLNGSSIAYQIKTGLKDTRIKTTRLARGLPTGAEIEYADEETLEEAIEGRR